MTQIFSYEIKGNLKDAIEFLQLPSTAVRIKVGRPDISLSVFSEKDGIEVNAEIFHGEKTKC